MDRETEESESPPPPASPPFIGSRTVAEVEQLVLRVSARSHLYELCAAIDAADWLLARAKTIHEIAKAKAVEWIMRNGDFDVGPVRYTVGRSTTTKCRDTQRCGVALLNSLEGDLDRFLGVLVAQPFKPRAAQTVLPANVWSDLFITSINNRLKTDTAEPTLQRIDTRFTRTRSS